MITIIKSPKPINGAYNNNSFNIISDNNNVTYYVVKVYNVLNEIVAKYKFFKLPSSNNVSFLLNQLLIDNVNTEIRNTNSLYYNFFGDFKYYLKISGLDTNGLIVENEIQSEEYTVIDAYFDEYNNEHVENYIVDGLRTAKYLTDFINEKPQLIALNQPMYFYIYSQINKPDITLQFIINGNITENRTIELVEGINAIKIKVEDIVTAIPLINIELVEFHLLDGSVQISDTMRLGINKECAKNNLSIVYRNKKGGYNSLLIEKASMKLTRNTSKITFNNGSHSQLINGIYSSSNSIVNLDENYIYDILTNHLTKDEEIIHANICASPEVFVELQNGDLLPIQIVNNSLTLTYKSNKRRRINIQFIASTPAFLNDDGKETEPYRSVTEQLNYIIHNFYSITNPNNTITIL